MRSEVRPQYMRRALQIAEAGRGNVSPNPLVGCVIVHDDRIIGEGYHQQYGAPHAEVNAINSVKNPELLTESTVYVTLEPCAHFGKTPPCADLLVKKKVKAVVIATLDPNPKVAGKGVEKLKTAGITVEAGLYENEAQDQNKRFFTLFNKKRPYIILKWAETKDGFIARKDFSSKWISSDYSRQLVHKWRSEEDAIMVGKNTALHDNPSLNVRDWVGKDPLRIVIDRKRSLPKDLKLFSDKHKTLCYTTKGNETTENVDFIKVAEDEFLRNIFLDLGKKNIQSVIVEGGATLINELAKENLWDEARIFVGQKTFGDGIKAPVLSGQLISTTFAGADELMIKENG